MTDTSHENLSQLILDTRKEVENLRMHISNLDEAMYHDRKRVFDTSKTVNGLVVKMDALIDRVDDLFDPQEDDNQAPGLPNYRIGHCSTCTCF